VEKNGFKKEAWQKARIAANSVYGTKLDLTQCKTKYASVGFLLPCICNIIIVNSKKLKTDYCMFKRLKENSGFGWNEERGLPTAVEGVLVLVTGPPGPRNRRPPAPPRSMAWGGVFFFSAPAAAPVQAPALFNAPDSHPSMNFPHTGSRFFLYSPLEPSSFDT